MGGDSDGSESCACQLTKQETADEFLPHITYHTSHITHHTTNNLFNIESVIVRIYRLCPTNIKCQRKDMLNSNCSQIYKLHINQRLVKMLHESEMKLE